MAGASTLSHRRWTPTVFLSPFGGPDWLQTTGPPEDLLNIEATPIFIPGNGWFQTLPLPGDNKILLPERALDRWFSALFVQDQKVRACTARCREPR